MAGGFLKKIMKVLKDIPSKLTCGTKFLKNFYFCCFFYIMHIWAYVLYLPFKIFFLITKLSKLEKTLWDVIYLVDGFFAMLFFGFHFVKWPEKILNNCYRCKKKKKKKNTTQRLGEKLRKMFYLGGDKFNFTFFLLVMGGAFYSFYLIYYYFLLPKKKLSVGELNNQLLIP